MRTRPLLSQVTHFNVKFITRDPARARSNLGAIARHTSSPRPNMGLSRLRTWVVVRRMTPPPATYPRDPTVW